MAALPPTPNIGWAYDNKKVESGTNIVNWTKGINGDVVVLLCSCHSGNTQEAARLIGLAQRRG
jgi:hypothetical protein